MRTIGFFGDSFCASNQPESWCNILQEKLGCPRAIHYGEPGRSIWSVFFKFNQLIEQDRVPDISVFCWTEPYRLYHPSLILSANTEPLEGVDPAVYRALDDYWKYLHSYDKDEMAYEYALRYYDQNVLSKVSKRIVQMWSFRPFETAGKDTGIRLQSGTFIDESMFSFAKGPEMATDISWQARHINHMTVEENQQWAQRVYERMKDV
jgi:hypothetical protein